MLQVHVSTPAGQAAALDSRNKVDRVTMPLGKGLVTTFTVTVAEAPSCEHNTRYIMLES